MDKKNIISGAMIVAAGLANTADKLSATTLDADNRVPRVTASGLAFDMVKLDDDVLKLGGVDVHGSAFAEEGDQVAQRGSDTLFTGSAPRRRLGGGNDTITPGRRFNTIVNPSNTITLPLHPLGKFSPPSDEPD